MSVKSFDTSIILIHQGDSEYLPATLLQLRHSNPSGRIILIGDAGNRHYRNWVDHYLISDFSSEATALRKFYVHHSTNGYEFELLCIQRWFVLNEFLKQSDLPRCIYLDSDILVYSELTGLQRDMEGFGMTVSGISAHTNFINDASALDDFCNFVRTAYTNTTAREGYKARFEDFLRLHPAGGISDMTHFSDYRQKYPGRIADISEVRNGGTFDITLDTIGDYEDAGGYKKVVWREDKPLVRHRKLNQYIRFHSLHFQGKCKARIYQYVTYPASMKLMSFLLRALYFKRWVVRKFGL